MSNSATPMEMRPHQWSKERFPLTAHIARHPFIYASLVLHTLLLWTFFSIGDMQLEQQTLARNESVVNSSMQRAAQSDMHRRVQALQKIEALLEQSLAKDSSSTPADAQTELEETLQTPEQMMQRAKQLLTSIQKMQDEFKIKEMARVLQIPEQQAAKKLQAGRTLEQSGTKKAAPTLEHIEQEAREVLAQRQRQLERAGNGLPILGGVRNFVKQAQELVVHGSGAGGSGSQQNAAGDTNGVGGRPVAQGKAGEASPSLAVQPAVLRVGSGNTFGSGGRYANRVSINSWYIIGPFEGADKTSIEKIYPPELAVDLDASYFGKYQRIVNWKYMHTNQDPMISTVRGDYAVYYGYAEIRMDQEREVWLTMGADGDSKVWVNNQVVWVSGNQDQPWHDTHFLDSKEDLRNLNRVEGRRKLHLKKGKNSVMFKLYNGVDASFFSLALVADAGNQK